MNLRSRLQELLFKITSNRLTPYLLFFCIALFITRNVLFETGSLGLGYDWAYYDTPSILKNYDREVWSAYSDRFLGSSATYNTSYIFSIVISILAGIGISGGIISKTLLIVPIFLSGSTMYLLLHKMFKFNTYVAFWASFAFMLSPFMFHKAVSGHSYNMLGYALLPLLLYLIINSFTALKKSSLTFYSLLSALTVFVMGAQIQLYMFAGVIYVLAFISVKARLSNKLYTGLIMSTVNAILVLPWVLPLLFIDNFEGAFEGKFNPLKIVKQSEIIDYYSAFQGREGYGSFFAKTLQNLPFHLEFLYSITAFFFVFITIYGFYILVSGQKAPPENTFSSRRFAFTVAIIFILTIFFAKGSNVPFGFLNLRLFETYQFMGFFRNTYHVIAVSVFLSVIMFAFGLEKILKTFHRGYLSNYAVVCVLMSGFLVAYISGNYGGYVNTYKSNTDLDGLSQTLGDNRVLFLPNLQPYVQSGADSDLGGWDSYQTYIDAHTVHQSEGQTPSDKYSILRMNYCLIFNQDCLNEVNEYIKTVGIKYIVVRSDVYSIYDSVSGIGGDRLSAKYRSTDYREAVKKLGYKSIQKNSTFELFDTGANGEELTLRQNPYVFVGGNAANTVDQVRVQGSFSGQRGNMIDTRSLVQNNRNALLGLESCRGCTLIEPGFYINNDSWRSYLSYWWRDHYLDSGYNGVQAAEDGVPYDFYITPRSSGPQTLWLNSSIIDYYGRSSIKIQIPDLNFERTVQLDDSSKIEGTIKIAEKLDIRGGPMKMTITSLSGLANVDSMFLSPDDMDIKALKTNALISTNIDTKNSRPLNMPLDVSSLGIGNTPNVASTVKVNSANSGVVNINASNGASGGYTRLTGVLNDATAQDLLDIGYVRYSVSSKNFRGSYIDTALDIVRPDGNKLTLRIDRHMLDSDQDHVISLSSFKRQLLNNDDLKNYSPSSLRISSVSLYINYRGEMGDKPGLSLREFGFMSSPNKVYSIARLTELSNKINLAKYYESIPQYLPSSQFEKIDLTKVQLTPDRTNGKSTAVSPIDESSITLSTTEDSSKSEYALMTVALNQAKKDNIIVMPIVNDQQRSYIDFEVIMRKPGSSDVRRLISERAVNINNVSYIIIDLSKVSIDNPGYSPDYVRVLFNKKHLESSGELNFKVDGLYYIDRVTFSGSPVDTSQVSTRVLVDATSPGLYKRIVTYSNGRQAVTDVSLVAGHNNVGIPYLPIDSSISSVTFLPNSNNQNIAAKVKYEKISSTKYQVRIDGAEGRYYLNLNYSYDPNWKIINASSVKNAVRGQNSSNMFIIDKKNGIDVFTIDYSVQKYRTLGLKLALYTIPIVILTIISTNYYMRRKNS
jgi:hypothetical protein